MEHLSRISCGTVPVLSERCCHPLGKISAFCIIKCKKEFGRRLKLEFESFNFTIFPVELSQESFGAWRIGHHRCPVTSRHVRKVRKTLPTWNELVPRGTPGQLFGQNFRRPAKVVERFEIRRKFAIPETSETSKAYDWRQALTEIESE